MGSDPVIKLGSVGIEPVINLGGYPHIKKIFFL